MGPGMEPFPMGTPQTDGAGNTIQQYKTYRTFRWAYTPKGGTRVWIAACKIPGGETKPTKRGHDLDDDGVKDVFTWIGHVNRLRGGDSRDYTRYTFFPSRNVLYVTTYEDNEITEQTTHDPAPTDVNDLNPWPSNDTGVCLSSPKWVLEMIDSTSEYYDYELRLDDAQDSKVNIGDTICISGDNIVSGCVQGDARKKRLGCWVVDKVGTRFVRFISNSEGYLSEGDSICVLRVYYENAVEGTILWTSNGDDLGAHGSTIGPSSRRE